MCSFYHYYRSSKLNQLLPANVVDHTLNNSTIQRFDSHLYNEYIIKDLGHYSRSVNRRHTSCKLSGANVSRSRIIQFLLFVYVNYQITYIEMRRNFWKIKQKFNFFSKTYLVVCSFLFFFSM